MLVVTNFILLGQPLLYTLYRPMWNLAENEMKWNDDDDDETGILGHIRFLNGCDKNGHFKLATITLLCILEKSDDNFQLTTQYNG